jgi:hypothetical protein
MSSKNSKTFQDLQGVLSVVHVADLTADLQRVLGWRDQPGIKANGRSLWVLFRDFPSSRLVVAALLPAFYSLKLLP